MTKVMYLRDLAAHAGTKGAEAAERLGVAVPAVLQAFRRALDQGLVVKSEGDRPHGFTITDAGREKLRVLERMETESSNPDGNPDGSVSTALADLQQRLSVIEESIPDVQDDLRALFRFVDKHLQEKAEARGEGGAGRGNPSNPKDNPGEPSAVMGAEQRRLVAELFESRQEKASLGFFDDKGPVNERIARLKEQIPLGVAQAVLRLRELETEDFRDSEGAEAEAVFLREKLGLPPAGNPDGEDADGEGADGELAEEASESDVWEEFFGSSSEG